MTGEKIFPLLWDVIEALELYDIPVVSHTSDGAKPNHRFYRICQYKKQTQYKTPNPFRIEQELFFFCDVPHLLKTAHNVSAIHFPTPKAVKCR